MLAVFQMLRIFLSQGRMKPFDRDGARPPEAVTSGKKETVKVVSFLNSTTALQCEFEQVI